MSTDPRLLNVQIGPLISDSGIHGCVYKGLYNDQTVAIKKLYDKNNCRELEYLKKFQGHPGIVTLIGMYELNVDHYIVIEYCQGDLGAIKLPTEKAINASLQLLSAIAHLHSLRCIHGDIKPENCLLDLCGNCRVTDFGGTLEMDENGKTLCKKAAVYTLGYASLEVIDKSQYSSMSDVFAAGATIFYFMTFESLFVAVEDESIRDIRLNMIHGVRKKRINPPKNVKTPFIRIPGGNYNNYFRIKTKERVMEIGPMGEIIMKMIERNVKYRTSCEHAIEKAALLGIPKSEQYLFLDCPMTNIQEAQTTEIETTSMVVSYPKVSQDEVKKISQFSSQTSDMIVSYDDPESPYNSQKCINSQSTETTMILSYDCTPSPKIGKFQPVLPNEEVKALKGMLELVRQDNKRLKYDNEYLKNQMRSTHQKLLEARAEVNKLKINNDGNVDPIKQGYKFKCKVCGKKFSKKCNLQRHERVHREKLIKCRHDTCDNKFTRTDIMEIHFQRKHTGVTNCH